MLGHSQIEEIKEIIEAHGYSFPKDTKEKDNIDLMRMLRLRHLGLRYQKVSFQIEKLMKEKEKIEQEMEEVLSQEAKKYVKKRRKLEKLFFSFS